MSAKNPWKGIDNFICGIFDFEDMDGVRVINLIFGVILIETFVNETLSHREVNKVLLKANLIYQLCKLSTIRFEKKKRFFV